jgi:hypothetical protein
MEPLSIAAAVVTITTRCIFTAKDLYSIYEKYTHAQTTISAIYTESTVIAASLGRIQNLICTRPEILRSNLQSQPDLTGIFNTALNGCSIVYQGLNNEVQKLIMAPDCIHNRIQAVWKEDIMKEFLEQIRGSQLALTLLMQTLQLLVASSYGS